MHDAAEAYLVDLPRPVKHHSTIGTEYRQVEDALLACIAKRFGLDPECPLGIKHADDIVLMTEKRDLMPHSKWEWSVEAEPLSARIFPVTPKEAKKQFMSRAFELGISHRIWKPKQYRPIILRTLQQAQGKYKTFEDFADYMISKMEDYEEMANMLAADGLIGELSRYRMTASDLNVILSPGDHAPLRVDVSDRFVPKESERHLPDDEIIRLKDTAIEKYRAELPPEIEVHAAAV